MKHRPTPTAAMVMAAGLGTRMRPLTDDRPKPLIPVGGKPLIEHAMDRLADAGISRAVVNTHYLAEKIESHLAGRACPAVAFSREDRLLDTGGGVRNALPLLGPGPFLTVASDVLWLDGPTPALKRLTGLWNPETMDVLLLLMATTKAVGYHGRGDFHMDACGRVHRRGEMEIAPFVYAGAMIVTPAAYDGISEDVFSNNLVWNRAAAAGRLYGMAHDGLWFHVGTPDAVAETDELLAHGGVRWVDP